VSDNIHLEIIQDFILLEDSYTPLYQSDENFYSVKAWLKHIKSLGFTQDMMQTMMKYVQDLKKEERFAEASQIILVSAATEDKLATFILARELFLGNLFTKNEAASFGLLSKLSEEMYPDALCDFAYFYRYGIVVPQDLKKAKQYYKQASELGLKRATKHYMAL